MDNNVLRFLDNSSMLQNTAITLDAETLVLANKLLAPDSYIQGALAYGTICLTPGAGTKTVTVQIRRGYGLGGSVAWTSPAIAVTPGATAAIPVSAVFPADAYLRPQGGQYSVTVKCTGATANGTLNYASMMWLVSSFPWDVPANVAVV